MVQKIKLLLPVQDIFIHLLRQTLEPCNKIFIVVYGSYHPSGILSGLYLSR